MAKTRILIVEDEPLIRLFVADSLEEYGFEVVEAANAADAAAKLDAQAGEIGAVIIDVGLPDRPGDELADQCRSKWADLPIVIASGRDTNEFLKRFSHDSRVTVLGKPYTTGMLVDALRAVGMSPATPG